MFDKILDLVKEQLSSDSQVASTIPDNQKDAVYNEVATHLTSGLTNHDTLEGGVGGLLSMLQDTNTTGNPLTNAMQGGLLNTLASKFNLPPAAVGAIAGALPGLLQKFAHKAADPDDKSITPDDISNIISKKGGLGDLFG